MHRAIRMDTRGVVRVDGKVEFLDRLLQRLRLNRSIGRAQLQHGDVGLLDLVDARGQIPGDSECPSIDHAAREIAGGEVS